jgi:hypothetical protein
VRVGAQVGELLLVGAGRAAVYSSVDDSEAAIPRTARLLDQRVERMTMSRRVA